MPTRERKLAFVLGGGGAHGASQVGALRALLEAGIYPDMMVGTSIGAANAAYLAVHGVTLESVEKLTQLWLDAIGIDILPSNYLWLSLRTLLGRPEESSTQRVREMLVQHGIAPQITFGQIQGVQLFVVAADLNSSNTIVYGVNPQESVLEGVLASTAIPPWIRPIETNGRYLVDGGFTSNLPVEIAMRMGAAEIIALDLSDPYGVRGQEHKTKPLISKVIDLVLLRQREIELALAEARGVPLLDVILCEDPNIPIWDFNHTKEMIAYGYAAMNKAIRTHQAGAPRWYRKLLPFGRGRQRVVNAVMSCGKG